MTTSRWRAWAELLAAVSVVVTLIVLVVEVRANTKAIERQILMDRTANVTAPYTSGPELLAAFEKVKRVDGWDPTQRAFMHQYGLEPGEAISWMMFLVRVWKGLDADFAYSGPSEQLATSITSLLSFPDNRIFYQPGVVSPPYGRHCWMKFCRTTRSRTTLSVPRSNPITARSATGTGPVSPNTSGPARR
ncbi:MAG: hypothetical protein P8049_13035 [Gemmatimonadota bacterium]